VTRKKSDEVYNAKRRAKRKAAREEKRRQKMLAKKAAIEKELSEMG
jgi:hypothetical protein